MTDRKVIVWDFDGVILTKYGGKGTTLLAEANPRSPRGYMDRFEGEAGTGPLSVVTADELRYAWNAWAEQRNGGKPIQTCGDLARCLTDLRHHIPTNRTDKAGNVFPGSDQTIYTKNSLLAGLSMADIDTIASEAEYTEGFDQAAERFFEEVWDQVVFSETVKPLIDAFSYNNFLDHAEAVPPVVLVNGREETYDREKHFERPNVTLTGRMTEGFKKDDRIFAYLTEQGIDPRNVVAIGDSNTDVPIIQRVIATGGRGFGFNTGKYGPQYQAAGIPRIKRVNLFDFFEVVHDPNKIAELCEAA